MQKAMSLFYLSNNIYLNLLKALTHGIFSYFGHAQNHLKVENKIKVY